MLRSGGENLKQILNNPYVKLTKPGQKIVFITQLLFLDDEAMSRVLIDQARSAENVSQLAEDLRGYTAADEQKMPLTRLQSMIDILNKNAALSTALKTDTSLPSVPAPTTTPTPTPVYNPYAFDHQPVATQIPVLPVMESHSVLQQSYSGLAQVERYGFLGKLLNHVDINYWHDIIAKQYALSVSGLMDLVSDIQEKHMFSSHPLMPRLVEEIQVLVTMRRSSEETINVPAALPQPIAIAPVSTPPVVQTSMNSNSFHAQAYHHDQPLHIREWIMDLSKLVAGKALTTKKRTEHALIRQLIKVLAGISSPSALIAHEKYCDVFGQDNMQNRYKDIIAYVERLAANENSHHSQASIKKWQ